MPHLAKTVSMHRNLVLTIIAVSIIILLTASMCLIKIVDQRNNKALISETDAWANTLAKISSRFLVSNKNDSHIALNDELKRLISTPLINSIQVYRSNVDGSIAYFSRYNKGNIFPAIDSKITQLSQLAAKKHDDKYLKIIINVTQEQHTLGYLVIQTSSLEQQDFINKLINTVFALLLFYLIIAFTVSQWLVKQANQPIMKLTQDIQHRLQNKNYSTQLAKQPHKELDILVEHINTLLLTIDKLHELEKQFIEQEKFALLGGMVAGVAHEVNTPLGLGVTASSVLADQLNEIKTAFEDKTLRSSQLKKFLTDGNESVAIIFRNLERAAQLISSFKVVAVDQSSEQYRTFNVKGLLAEVLLLLTAKIKTAAVIVSVNCADDLYIKSKPGAINQIFINLILNSINHAFTGLSHNIITITVKLLKTKLVITYSDNGIGIDNSMKSIIFEPFTTTKRDSGGSGLGMHLVYNLVSQILDGEIKLAATIEPGVCFELCFPIE